MARNRRFKYAKLKKNAKERNHLIKENKMRPENGEKIDACGRREKKYEKGNVERFIWFSVATVFSI